LQLRGSQRAERKRALIEKDNGTGHLVDHADASYVEAESLAEGVRRSLQGPVHLLERATDGRGNNNIAESLFEQMSMEPNPVPS
jgi:cysteine synthase